MIRFRINVDRKASMGPCGDSSFSFKSRPSPKKIRICISTFNKTDKSNIGFPPCISEKASGSDSRGAGQAVAAKDALKLSLKILMLSDKLLVPEIAFLRRALALRIVIVHAHQTIALLVAVDPAVKIHRRPDVIALQIHAVLLRLQNIMEIIAQELNPLVIFNIAVFIRDVVTAVAVFP